MAALTFKVELDVSGSAFGAAFVSTDVSAKAVAGGGFEATTVTWGRQDQHSDVTPTTVDGVLQNSDGTFTPGNTAGVYYPRIRRNLRRRVSVGVNATSVRLSDDYAASIEVEPSRDSLPVTRLQGADVLARLGLASNVQDVSALSIGTTLRSFLAEEMMLDAPSALYMMQEASGSSSFADVTGVASPLVVINSKYGSGTISGGQSPSTTFYGGTLVGFSNPTYGTATRGGSWLAATVPQLSGTYSIECWVQMPSVAPASVEALILDLGPVSLFGIETSGKVEYQDSTIRTAASLCDGKVHQLVATVSAGAVLLYVDKVQVASGTTPSNPRTTLNVGGFDDGLGGANELTGAVAYIGLFPTALSSTRITAHYNAGVTAFAGERTDQRITRLLAYRTNTGSSVDTGLGVMGVQTIQGRSVQDCLYEVAQTEAGVIFTDGLGQINFRSRSRLFNPTPAVTLSMTAGGVDFGSNWREDTQNIINDATVTNSTTGSAQRFFSSASITTDGEYASSVSVPLNSDQAALNLAGWIVSNGTLQQLTATPLIVNLLHLTAAQAQAVLGLKPLDCIQLTNCPTPAPAATMTFIVQGGTTSLAADAATVSLNLTPAPYPVGTWDSTTWDAAGVTWAF